MSVQCTFDSGGSMATGALTLSYEWEPSPRWIAELTIQDGTLFVFEAMVNDRVVVASLPNGQTLRLSGMSSQGNVLRARPIDPPDVVLSPAAERVHFFVPNLRSYRSIRGRGGETGFNFDVGEFGLRLFPAQDLKERLDWMRSTGRHTVTYELEARRRDATAVTPADVHVLERFLHTWLSFAVGRPASAILATGLDDDG